MTARLRSWWQIIRKPLQITMITLLIIALVALVSVVILGYIFQWDWTGFVPYAYPSHTNNSNFQPGKTLWDWLQLLGVLAIPVVVGFGVAWFTREQQKRDRQLADQRDKRERDAADERAKIEQNIASDNQRETALQAYLDKMSELLLEKSLLESTAGEKVRQIARVRTLTVLHRLDPIRKGNVLQFLHESGLIDKDKCVVDLSEADLFKADLSEADLFKADLSGADLGFANLSKANLGMADLSKARLFGANLSEANLSGANLSDANLMSANLKGARVVEANMHGAFLMGAILGDIIITDEQLSRRHKLALPGEIAPNTPLP